MDKLTQLESKQYKKLKLNQAGSELTASLVLVIGVLPFHHVIVAGGLEPYTEQLNSYDVSADSGWFSPCNLTINGRTEKKGFD